MADQRLQHLVLGQVKCFVPEKTEQILQLGQELGREIAEDLAEILLVLERTG